MTPEEIKQILSDTLQEALEDPEHPLHMPLREQISQIVHQEMDFPPDLHEDFFDAPPIDMGPLPPPPPLEGEIDPDDFNPSTWEEDPLDDWTEESPFDGLDDIYDQVYDPSTIVECEELLREIVAEAQQRQARYIHLHPQGETIELRYRMGHVLKTGRELNREKYRIFLARIKIMAGLDILEQRQEQCGRFTTDLPDGGEVTCLVAVVPTYQGERLRLCCPPTDLTPRPLDQLDLGSDTLRSLQEYLQHPRGIFLVAGPRNSGQSTLLYSLLQFLDRPDRNLFTVEDSIESAFPRVAQIQVGQGISFSAGLRACLRQDADGVICHTSQGGHFFPQIAELARQGCFVLSGIEGDNIPSVLDFLVHHNDYDPSWIAHLHCILVQKLVRRICPHCREKHSPHIHQLKLLENLGMNLEGGDWWQGQGCKKCHDTGYLGAVALHEYLCLTPDRKALLYREKSSQSILAEAREMGFVSLGEDGWKKAAQGLTTLDEVFRAAPPAWPAT